MCLHSSPTDKPESTGKDCFCPAVITWYSEFASNVIGPWKFISYCYSKRTPDFTSLWYSTRVLPYLSIVCAHMCTLSLNQSACKPSGPHFRDARTRGEGLPRKFDHDDCHANFLNGKFLRTFLIVLASSQGFAIYIDGILRKDESS